MSATKCISMMKTEFKRKTKASVSFCDIQQTYNEEYKKNPPTKHANYEYYSITSL